MKLTGILIVLLAVGAVSIAPRQDATPETETNRQRFERQLERLERAVDELVKPKATSPLDGSGGSGRFPVSRKWIINPATAGLRTEAMNADLADLQEQQ